MIKAILTSGDLIFGLSKVNIEKLQQGLPILINLKDMGLEDRKIVIIYGETEDEIFKDLPFNVGPNTKMNY